MVSQINFALVAQTHPPMYLMHKYWARKPHNVVAEYIQHYTNEGDIILDPFAGSGVTAIEAVRLGRKSIAIDLDPVATFITRMTALPINLKEFESSFKEIENDAKKKINELYKTKCIKCGNTGVTTHSVWQDKSDKEILTEVWYKCKCHNNTLKKKPGKEDFTTLEKIEKMKIPYWYPTTKLMYNHLPFIKKEKRNAIDELFHKRELIALSILYNEIGKTKNKDIKDLLKFVFTSGVVFSSKLIFNRSSVGGPGWNVHSYWVPPNRLIRNVWEFFEERYQKIYRGKEDSNNRIKDYKEAKSFEELINGKNIFIKTHNALELTDIIQPNSIDYIFTDPPYGGAIQYFELSTLWASWLKNDLDYKDEITINKNQNKDFDYYHKMLKAAFSQMYTVLKPGKYLTVTFHSTDIGVWNSIIKAVVLAGFELEKILYQPPALASAKGQLQPYGSAVGDYYIRFRKPEQENHVSEKEMDFKRYESEVIWSAERILNERGESTIYQHILNGIMADLQGGRYVPIGAKNIDEVLKEQIGKKFDLIEVKDEKGKRIGVKWWLKGKDFSNFSIPSLRDRVEAAILKLLDKKVKVSFDEVLQSIFVEFPNALTPDTQDIGEILKEYASKTKDGKWRLKPGLSENERISRHTEMIYYLALLGKKAGFNILVGKNEQSQKYEGKTLRELDDEKEIRVNRDSSFKNERIRQIDVLWINKVNDRIEYEFEIENTTGITDAIIRGSNLDAQMVKRFIIIPEERENLLHKRLQEPLITQSVQKQGWHFIRYQDLEDLFNAFKRKSKFDVNELDTVAKVPKVRGEKQKTLNDVK